MLVARYSLQQQENETEEEEKMVLLTREKAHVCQGHLLGAWAQCCTTLPHAPWLYTQNQQQRTKVGERDGTKRVVSTTASHLILLLQPSQSVSQSFSQSSATQNKICRIGKKIHMKVGGCW